MSHRAPLCVHQRPCGCVYWRTTMQGLKRRAIACDLHAGELLALEAELAMALLGSEEPPGNTPNTGETP